jgi:purine-binding chemotaxis protein CheW
MEPRLNRDASPGEHDMTPIEQRDHAKAAGLQQFLAFQLGAEEYGIDILRVQEIRAYEKATRIPNTPDFMKGVINLRGVIVPVVDLRMKFGLETAEYNDVTVVVVLNVADRTVGVVVDSVSDVLSLAPGDIRPAPEFTASVDNAFVRGLATLDRRMLIIADIERLMTGADMALALVH